MFHINSHRNSSFNPIKLKLVLFIAICTYVLHTTVQCYYFERCVLILGRRSYYFLNNSHTSRTTIEVPLLTFFLIGYSHFHSLPFKFDFGNNQPSPFL